MYVNILLYWKQLIAINQFYSPNLRQYIYYTLSPNVESASHYHKKNPASVIRTLKQRGSRITPY